MKKSRFTETQIVAIMKEADSGMLVKDVCRKHGISEPAYYASRGTPWELLPSAQH